MEGIVLKKTSFGESNSYMHILTSDKGLIISSAQAVRKESSKLKSSVQEYSLSSISCIKSKNGWKMTNASAKRNYFFDSSVFARPVLGKIVSFLVRMIPGEHPHREIFDIVKSGFDNIIIVEKEKLQLVEILLVLRVLHELGYIAKSSENNNFFSNYIDWSENILQKVFESKDFLIKEINNALKISQL